MSDKATVRVFYCDNLPGNSLQKPMGFTKVTNLNVLLYFLN